MQGPLFCSGLVMVEDEDESNIKVKTKNEMPAIIIAVVRAIEMSLSLFPYCYILAYETDLIGNCK